MSPLPNQISQPSKLIQPYRVASRHFKLGAFDPSDTQGLHLKDKAAKLLKDQISVLSDLQRKLYVQDRWAVLLLIQGMDSAGKDSVIRHVMSGVNIEGCEAYSFKVPTDDDLNHDFIWRYAKSLPQRGHIGIFNRSYYEDVLSVRVNPQVFEKQRVPAPLVTERIWDERFEYFLAFEQYLTRNGIVLCKIYLNVSKEEQKRRFLRRLDTSDKQWKYTAADIRDRRDWEKYFSANEDMIRRTAVPYAPWYVVPANHKWFTRLVVAGILIETLTSLKLEYPKLSGQQKKDINIARRILRDES